MKIKRRISPFELGLCIALFLTLVVGPSTCHAAGTTWVQFNDIDKRVMNMATVTTFNIPKPGKSGRESEAILLYVGAGATATGHVWVLHYESPEEAKKEIERLRRILFLPVKQSD